MHFSRSDHDRVTAAVTAAEATTDGEIVTIVARRSDRYHDAALQWAVLAMVLTLASIAIRPAMAEWVCARIDPWTVPPTGMLLGAATALALIAFLVVRFALNWMPLRIALTPGSTKTRRVHARALMLFRAGAEKRTRAKTAVLLYLSIDERRAEIVADAAIHDRVAPESWGAAMAGVIGAVRDGRAADGMVDAVTQIGTLLSDHFPRSETDVNELPDRLIIL